MAKFNWLKVLRIVAPIVLGLIPQIPKALIPVIVEGIGAAEETDWDGPDKLTFVMQMPELGRVEVPAIQQGVNAAVEAANALTRK